MSNPHDKFFPAQEIERFRLRDYLGTVAVALAFLALVAVAI